MEPKKNEWNANSLLDNSRMTCDTYRVFLLIRSVGLSKGSCPVKRGVLVSETEVPSGETRYEPLRFPREIRKMKMP